jgi:hypothetical protein
MNILYSGPYTDDHGFNLLLRSFELLASHPHLSSFLQFTFTRISDDSILRLPTVFIDLYTCTFHSNLTFSSYSSLLNNIDICLVLQSSSLSKTHFPSKIIEYLQHSKKVITTYYSLELSKFSQFIHFIDESPEQLFACFSDISSLGEINRHDLQSTLLDASLIESEALNHFLLS